MPFLKTCDGMLLCKNFEVLEGDCNSNVMGRSDKLSSLVVTEIFQVIGHLLIGTLAVSLMLVIRSG